jgi:hypothetical protein
VTAGEPPEIAAFVAAAMEALACARAMPVGLGMSSAEAKPGIYAIHGPPVVWAELTLGEPPDERPLYVGKSESSLAGRDVRDHFGFVGETRTTSITGYSTVRRSIASLLHDRCEYRGVPRNPSKPGNFTNFGLARPQDPKLSDWMRERLALACWPKPDSCSIETLGRVERAVFLLLLPPLNLSQVQTAWKSQVCRARKVMAMESRGWTPG